MPYNEPKANQNQNQKQNQSQPAKPVLPAGNKPITANDAAKAKPADATKTPTAKTGTV